MLILAIDLGSSKSVFCKFDSNSGKHSFGQVASHSASFCKLLALLRPELVVVEVGPLAAIVYDVAEELGVPTIVADTMQEAWLHRTVKRRTDRDDALKLARMAAMRQLNRVHIPPAEMRQWRRLLSAREALVTEQTRGKIRIRALLRSVEQPVPRGKCGWSQKVRVELWTLARPLAECSAQELWRGQLHLELERLDLIERQMAQYDEKLAAWAAENKHIQRLMTVPGVGVVTAAAIVATIDNPHRFPSRRQVACYAGLTPRLLLSCTVNHGNGRISKRGNALLRRILNQAAWMVIRFDPRFCEMYLRISQGGRRGRRQQAVVAVMRKLLVICWAMMRDQRAYRADWCRRGSTEASSAA